MFAKFINIHRFVRKGISFSRETYFFFTELNAFAIEKKINIIKNFANATFNKMRNYTKFTSTANRLFTIDIYLS